MIRIEVFSVQRSNAFFYSEWRVFSLSQT